ncbi:unnamed protein product [Tilletia controversa]|nr:unnamed protein product [Tilletia controversa]
MADTGPIVFAEHLSLPNVGIHADSISFANVTLESENFVCVRESINGQNQVAIIDLNDVNNVMRRPITADSAIMNPIQKIIALKSGRQLQIFNIEAKAKVKAHAIHDDVVFWKWISNSLIGIVTNTAVYHWSIEGDSVPQKIFDRHSDLDRAQIINYRSTPDGKWLFLVGISNNTSTAADAFRVKGNIQLYSVERGISQPIVGHAAAFAELKVGDVAAPYKLFAFANRTATGAKLHIVEIDHNAASPVFTKKAVDVFFPPEATSDFPVAMQVSKRYGIVYLVTKYGFIHLYDLETGACIYMNRISGDTIFVTSEYEATSGIIGINRKGQVLSVTADENTLVSYILRTLNNADLALKMATRASLPGADDLYLQQFHTLFSTGQYLEAAKCAASSPRGILRTPQTVEQFKQVPSQPGALSPILQYFSTLLERGSLNKFESLELARPVLAQNKKQLLEKWLKENKLECSEELGDIVRLHDMNLALSVYLRANVPNKVVACFAETGQFDKIVLYAKKVNYTPDYAALLQHIVRVNPEQGSQFASSLIGDESGPLVDIERVTDIFMSQNLIQQATSFLLDALKDNKPEQAHLQTRLLEMNLVHAPQVADAILGNQMFTHYDRPRIANLCEKAGLLQRALDHYEDPADIKRVIVQASTLDQDWLVTYFGKLTVEQSLDIMREMLKVNIRQHLQVVIKIATKYSDLLGPVKLMEMFEQFKTYEGLYYYLGAVVNLSTDSEVHFKYIQAATRTGQIREVERICRESNHYNAEKVKNFLKEAKLSDQLPLIIVCDRFDFVHDLVLYLYQNMMIQYIEVYVQKVNSSRTPQVIGGLLDVDCDEGVIKNLLMSVTGPIPIDELVEEVEKRNRLKLILPWLQSRIEAGQQDTPLYNALAKIYIDTNNNAEAFLKDNNLYEPRVVGKYCEKRDPYLAYIAYAKGLCDDELINLTNNNSMFKYQARYLVMRRQLDLWAQVLQADNVHRRALVDQVVSTAVPESVNPDDVSATVKAFMAADLPHELIELLEKIVLEPSSFSDNRSLQNLLLLTAVRTDKGKVMNYIDRLSAYDVDEIAKIAIEHGLYEEAFRIYTKAEQHIDGMNVLVEHVVSIDRGVQYANKLNLPEVWSRLGKAQLDGLRVKDAIESYIKAEDPSNYAEVIEIAEHAGREEELIRYLQMARKKAREPQIDTSLAFCLAKANRISDMEEFLSMTNVADILSVGEKCFNDELYEAAKVLFSSISNYARLATTFLYLNQWDEAVSAARKAGNTSVWRQVLKATLSRREFKLAEVAGLAIVPQAELLDDVVKDYHRAGAFDELVALLENSLGMERAHKALFTQTAIAISMFRPKSLMEWLRTYWGRCSLPAVIKVTREAHQWDATIFCLMKDAEIDSAALTMLEHASDAFNHDIMLEILPKISNTEILYRAASFYLEQHPLLLNDLLAHINQRVQTDRIVRLFRKSDNLPLIRSWLSSVYAEKDHPEVTDAYFSLLREEEEPALLRSAITSVTNFDQMTLASELQRHPLLAFRRISAELYKRAGQHTKAIEVAKEDRLFREVIEIAGDSNDVEIAHEVLDYFVKTGMKEQFTALLYGCYHLLEEDVIIETAWRSGLNDFAQPYFIQKAHDRRRFERETFEQLKKLAERKAEVDEANDAPIIGPGGMGPKMITAAPTGFGYGGMNGGGMQPQATGYMSGMF